MTQGMTKKRVKFQLDTNKIVDILEGYKPSLKRELRQLRTMGIIDYTPIEKYSTIWLFKIPNRKTCTYQGLYMSFQEGLKKVKNPENVSSASYQIREMLKNAKSSN